MSNAEFKKRFSQIIKRTGDNAESVVRQTALQLQKRMIERSPVGNPDLWKSGAPPGYVGGRFRANWQCGIGAVNTSTAAQPGADGEGRTRTALQGWKAGQTIWLTNSLPYSRKIEYGHSSQAPSGVVRLTVQEYGQYLKKVVSELK